MTLAGGRFGPSFKTQHTDKYWPPDPEIKFQNAGKKIVQLVFKKLEMEVLMSQCKFYGAEYYEEDS